jgi:hypothetical protein
MKLVEKTKILLSFIILSCFTAMMSGCFQDHGTQSKTLIGFKTTLDTSLVKASTGVKISLLDTENISTVKMECTGNKPVPAVIFKESTEKWKLSDFKYVAIDIKNLGNEDLLVECRPSNLGWFGGGQIIPAGEKRTARAYIQRVDEYPSYLDKKFIGMDALPGGIIKSFWWCPMHPDSIHSLSVVIADPYPNAAILISNIRGEGSINPPTEEELDEDYFPIIDEFGQFNKKDWPGKINSLSELIASQEVEKKDIASNPGPDNWDRYGGWINGPLLKATGHFRTEKIKGKWWLVDPEGRLFWSHGMGCVNFRNSTPVTGREHYFTNLPDKNLFKDFYVTASLNVPKGYYKGQRTLESFDHFSWNLLKKYGQNWKAQSKDLAHLRLRSWGMNTIGNFSDPEITGMKKTPYTGTLSSNAPRRIEASEGAWSKFPDPFDVSFIDALTTNIINVRQSSLDPYCIGYFVDNELFWGDASYIAKAIIQSGKDQPSKIKMIDYLKKKYGSINALNKKWQTSFHGWENLLENTRLPSVEVDDIRNFSTIVANKYFRSVKQTLAKLAPNKLYLGCRFDFHYYPNEDTTENWVVKIAARYCDVVSFNRYRYSAGDLRPADTDKPIMIGEWHMGALDRGMLHFSLRFAENQENRAEMYLYYINSCLHNPYIIGAHWFQYFDQPVLGRSDGECLNTGFLDCCDNTYPEMVKASRSIGQTMYLIRISDDK